MWQESMLGLGHIGTIGIIGIIYNPVRRFMFEKTFYTNKKILITGHTGFKGTWLCALLLQAGARLL